MERKYYEPNSMQVQSAVRGFDIRHSSRKRFFALKVVLTVAAICFLVYTAFRILGK